MRKLFKYIVVTIVFGIGIYWWFCLPTKLFDISYSSVLYDTDGGLLGARIAADEQWRFPSSDSLPQKYIEAVLCFEDKRFYNHPGVDILAVLRAIKLNLKAKRIVSGASTITMQVMRLSRMGTPRSMREKIHEAAMATRADFRYSKNELLNLYAAHAPFGGNVVGLEAAMWRYFGKPPHLMTWAEAATLAVLPNSPSLIHLGRNRKFLKDKRDKLLDDLVLENVLSEEEASLSKLEPIPNKPIALPQLAPHYLNYYCARNEHNIPSTINKQLQISVNDIVEYRHQILSENSIQNIAVIVLDVQTNDVLAYVGNTKDQSFSHENAIDMVQAERSSGSILKPLLYASAIQDGIIYPKMLLPDYPTTIAGYRPENYLRDYDGMVKADEALYRSLNIPAVKLLQKYGVDKFRSKLKKVGISTLHYSADHYGLPLIIGGAEITLWDIAHVYANMAYILSNAFEFNHDKSASGEWDYGALFETISAMQNARRPDENGEWQNFSNAQKIAWKTGTSYGFKDAWAVGVTPEYAVGVWVGNANAEGRPELVGVKAAAPILFDIFRKLPNKKEFELPFDAMKEVLICQHSGHPANSFCTNSKLEWIPKINYVAPQCPYHEQLFLDKTKIYSVHKNCISSNEIIDTTYFNLAPNAAFYYKNSHPNYSVKPTLHPDCISNSSFTNQYDTDIQIIYPSLGSKIFVPRDYDGIQQELICAAADGGKRNRLFWYLDNTFLGTTDEFHTMAIQPSKGDHQLLVINEAGNRSSTTFEILSKQVKTR